MVKNNGSRTNEQAFWEKFSAIYGADRARADQPLFEEFYANDFSAARESCGFNAAAAETGMDVFLLTDYLINTKWRDLSDYPKGNFAALNAYLDRLRREN